MELKWFIFYDQHHEEDGEYVEENLFCPPYLFYIISGDSASDAVKELGRQPRLRGIETNWRDRFAYHRAVTMEDAVRIRSGNLGSYVGMPEAIGGVVSVDEFLAKPYVFIVNNTAAIVKNAGCKCKCCDEFKYMAEPNQPDGTLLCYVCRQNPVRGFY